MKRLSGKNILLGVTGSIAAYKGAELVRRLREEGAEVRVVMTHGATRFITPLSMQALSGLPVRTELMDPGAEAAMGHIELARWAELLLVAPASADFLARLAQGRADDLLCAMCLARDAPLAVAPAMNTRMWLNSATRANVEVLRGYGIHLFGPEEGVQACGEEGPGRMLEPAAILEQVLGVFSSGVLAGCRVLVTAGPTREAIDPVRFISNRSSGKMGYAIAQAAAEAGAAVFLVSGPVALDCPPAVQRVMVETAAEMHSVVMAHAGASDIVIAVAAVADYAPARAEEHKLKKGPRELMLTLHQTPDILAGVSALPASPFTVGFAAETESLEANARKKRMAKCIDMVAANRVGRRGTGFDADDNELQLIWEGGSRHLPRTSKQHLARQLVEIIAERYRLRNRANATTGDHAEDSA